MGQNIACRFDEKTLQFVGNPIEQARCLLRPNKIGGVLEAQLKTLPKPLEKLIGEKVKIKKENLRRFLSRNKINENDIGDHTYPRAKVQLAQLLIANGQAAQARAEIHEVIADDPHAPAFQRKRDRVWIQRAKKLGQQLG